MSTQMPSPRRSRPRSLLTVITVAVAAFVLAACSPGQVQPREYGEVNSEGEGYYGNFMYGCTGVLPNEDGEYVDPTLENADFCRCVFEGLKEKVPFDQVAEFDEAQADAASDGSEVTIPKPIDEVRASCADKADGER